MKWIRTIDKLPETDVHVLTFDGESVETGKYNKNEKEPWRILDFLSSEQSFSYSYPLHKITHWMHYPEKPEE